jgi:lipopolysaccharide export system protein LptA
MKTLTITLLVLLLSPFALTAWANDITFSGKLVNVVLGNQIDVDAVINSKGNDVKIAEDYYPNTLFMTIEANGIRYICTQYARHTSSLHSGKLIVGETVTILVQADKAKVTASDGTSVKTTIIKREKINP